MKMKKVVVTGANGFIGRNLIKFLVLNDVSVIAVDLTWKNSTISELRNVKKVICDLSEIKLLTEMISDRDVDVFYHLAWAGAAGEERGNYIKQCQNVVSTCDAAIVAKSLGCKRFITPGTITENVVNDILEKHYTTDAMIYALTKVYTHNLLDIVSHKIGLEYVWARLTNIFGGDNKNGNLISYTLTQFENGNVPTYGPCEQPYNFTYIDDIIKAMYLLGEADCVSNEYYIGNGECRQLKEYLQSIAKICDCRIGIGVRDDDGVKYNCEWFSNDKLVNEIGFVPNYTFEDGVRIIIQERKF